MSVSIVIPCKNEEWYIGNLLDDLAHQEGIHTIPIIIADADSTDKTLQVIEFYEHLYPYLNVTVIKGGTVSVGRNRGSLLCNTKYILFIDSDVRLFKTDTIQKSYELLEKTGKKLLTCNLKSYSPDIRSKMSFSLYNLIHRLLVIKYPFAIGAYFFVNRESFNHFGKFNEKSDNSEDFLFSQHYTPKEFVVLNHFIGQDDRRFKKMGYFGMAKHLVVNLFRYIINGREEFTKKSKYWE